MKNKMYFFFRLTSRLRCGPKVWALQLAFNICRKYIEDPADYQDPKTPFQFIPLTLLVNFLKLK